MDTSRPRKRYVAGQSGTKSMTYPQNGTLFPRVQPDYGPPKKPAERAREAAVDLVHHPEDFGTPRKGAQRAMARHDVPDQSKGQFYRFLREYKSTYGTSTTDSNPDLGRAEQQSPAQSTPQVVSPEERASLQPQRQSVEPTLQATLESSATPKGTKDDCLSWCVQELRREQRKAKLRNQSHMRSRGARQIFKEAADSDEWVAVPSHTSVINYSQVDSN